MSPVTGIVLVLVLCYAGVSADDVPVTEATPPKPDQEKPGSCPADLDYPTCTVGTTKKKPECAVDKDCNGTRKCCFSGCEWRCLLPLYVKMNACPYFNYTRCALIKPSPTTCHSDNQCPGTDRCCCYCSTYHCTATVKPGQCPAKKACKKPVPSPLCSSDDDCPGKKRCCDDCGFKCVPPRAPVKEHPGVCKENQENLSCINLEKSLCASDADCDKDQKCCVSGNSRQCEVALKEKPGECPNMLAKCVDPLPPALCQNDSVCPGAMKCCKSPCQMKCTDPIINKPGDCPIPSTRCADTLLSPLCYKDSDCSGDEKCCTPLCRQQCTKPIIKNKYFP